MVTLTPETIGSGKDYTTIVGWETAHTDPISDDKLYRGDIFDTADYNEALVFDNCLTNTDSTRYRHLLAADGEAYDPDSDTGVWIYHATIASVLDLVEDYFRLGGPGNSIGASYTGSANLGTAIVAEGDEITVNSVYGIVDVSANYNRVFGASSSNLTTYFINCIAEGDYGITNNDGAAYGFRSDAATTDMNCYNCLSIGVDHKEGSHYDSSFKYAEGSETGDIQNCISFANFSLASGCYEVTTAGTESHNAATDATASGTGALDNQTTTDFLVNPVKHGDYTLKSGSNGIGAGTDLSGVFTLDFWGNEHGAAPGGWDMGPYAQLAADGDTILNFERGVGRGVGRGVCVGVG